MAFHSKIKVKFNKTYQYSTEQLRQHTHTYIHKKQCYGQYVTPIVQKHYRHLTGH